MSQSMQGAGQEERVAVIAVHGVGDQISGASAREIAGLLQVAYQGQQNAPSVGPFVESRLDLPVTKRQPGPPPSGAGPDIKFTGEGLARVQVDEKLSRYPTLKLSGERRGDDGRTTRIDIFELYWADLSRLGEGTLQLLGSLYQLLFHLASVGAKTVRHAWEAQPGVRLRILKWVHDAAEAMIGAVIPLLNLFMLAAILPVFVVVWTPAGAQPVIGGLLVGALAGYLTFWGIRRTVGTPGGSALRPLVPVVVFGIVSVVVAYCLWQLDPTPKGAEERPMASSAFFFEFSAVLFFIAWFLTLKLHKRREGGWASAAICTAILASVVWGGLFCMKLGGFDLRQALSVGQIGVVELTLHTAEGFMGVLEVLWLLFAIIGWLMVILGLVAGGRAPWHGPLRRAIWTGKMGVFLPASLFFTLTLVIWSALLKMLPERLSKPPYLYESWLFTGKSTLFPGQEWLFPALKPGADGKMPDTAGLAGPALLDTAAGAGFNVFVLCLFVALIIAVVGMAPCIAAEVKATVGGNTGEARRLGAWLDRGFKAIRIGGYLMLAGWLLLPVVEAVFSLNPQLEQERPWLTDNALLLWLGGTIVASVGIVLTLRNVLFQAVGKVVDIGLDVDNWLKERPFSTNPRGRILSRYLALLEHVCRDASYKRVVIVAHSQGTVVSADLLRYLTQHAAARPQNVFDKVPIRLATFGSPLYQLYSLRFPHLYGWVRGAAAAQSGAQYPDPAQLGVEAWVNGYRTGDYVGRFVATQPGKDPPHSDPWMPGSAFPNWHSGNVADYCVGAGAHTHYFDETAPHVGRLLDELIAQP